MGTTANPTVETTTVSLSQIALEDTSGTARPGPLMSQWVRDLALARKNTGKLSPLLLWRNPNTPEGPLIILDGRHRISAYQTLGIDASIPARMVSCPWREALLRSGHAHSRAALPLTSEQRADFAWRLVREPGTTYTKREIVNATAVGTRTVARMRARFREFVAANREVEVSGSWWRDRKDAQQEAPGEPLDDERWEELKSEGVKEIRNLLDRRDGTEWKQDGGIVDAALAEALGEQRVKFLFEYTFPTTEEAGDWAALPPTPEGPEDALVDF